MTTTLQTWATGPELTRAQFAVISDLVKGRCGINLHDGKVALVRARLGKRLRSLGLTDFGQYVEWISQDTTGAETAAMLDALTTNLTHFFREPRHFELLGSTVAGIIDRRQHDRPLRIWSAGCSSGEEPYSIAVTLQEAAAGPVGWDARILATDLSRQMLKIAKSGLYASGQLREMAPRLIKKYFTPCRDPAGRRYRIDASVRRMVDFAQLNLMAPWPMKGAFDVIFCRNVMIYFDKPTQHRLIERFWDALAPEGLLFLGHSESLTGAAPRYHYVEPAVYRKK